MPSRSLRRDEAMKPCFLGIEVPIEFGLTRHVVWIRTGHRTALAGETDALASIAGLETP